MDRPETDQQEPSGLSRFAIPAGAEAAPLSAHLVKDFDAAVERENFSHGYEQEDE